jgi:hypothetical protein
MIESSLEELCELGQRLLMETRYLEAEAALVQAERLADEAEDWDSLSRLYMPLQEARRQRRQRCGEGLVRLDLLTNGPNDTLNAQEILTTYAHSQLLVAGWGSIQPAIELRSLAAARGLYAETFLAAVYPIGDTRAIVIVPTASVQLPAVRNQAIDDLLTQLPPHCIVLAERELPVGPQNSTPETYGHVMNLWERLHLPFLAMADATPDPRRRIEGYRQTIAVDYACELAHQRLSDTARELARTQKRSASATP